LQIAGKFSCIGRSMDNNREVRVPLLANNNVPFIQMAPPALDMTPFDPNSNGLFQILPSKHQSGRTLQNQISQVKYEMQVTAQSNHVAMKDGLNYEQMLKALLSNDEKLEFGGNPLIFSGVKFDESPHLMSGSYAKKDCTERSFPGGHLIITNRRLLLLSATSFSGAKLQTYGEPKKLPGGYTVSCEIQDSVWYFPIPLSNLKSVSLYASSYSQAQESLEGYGCGFLCCMCSKDWKRRNPSTTISNVRNVLLGVVMPPWDLKTDVTISVDMSMSMEFVLDMVSVLQKHTHQI